MSILHELALRPLRGLLRLNDTDPSPIILLIRKNTDLPINHRSDVARTISALKFLDLDSTGTACWISLFWTPSVEPHRAKMLELVDERNDQTGVAAEGPFDG